MTGASKILDLYPSNISTCIMATASIDQYGVGWTAVEILPN